MWKAGGREAELLARAIEWVHLLVGFITTFGWIAVTGSFWKFHLALCFSILAGWSAFGACFLTRACCMLRGEPAARSSFLLGVRRKVLGLMFTGTVYGGEVDPAGVTVICLSALATLVQKDALLAFGFGALLGSGLAINRWQDHRVPVAASAD